MYKTGYEKMIENEEYYENSIKKSMKLLKLLYNYSNKNKEGVYLIKYINVIFGFCCAECDYIILKEISKDIIDNCSNESKTNISTFLLQKTLKQYLSSLDSTLDYLDKLYKELTKKNKEVHFHRKDNKISEYINDVRNKVLHEGVPIILIDNQTLNQGCYAHTFGRTEISCSLRVVLEEDKNKEYGLETLLEITYNPVRKLLEEKTNELIKIFNTN